MSGPRRWPVHPPPAPVEALTSWLGRLAGLYGLSVGDLMAHNLGSASALWRSPACADLDWDPPPAVLAALADRTGVDVQQLRPMTMAGWVPWLLEDLDCSGQEAFDTYVRQDSVLLAPGTDLANAWQTRRLPDIPWRPWLTAWPMNVSSRRVCLACVADPACPVPLTARLPIMGSCTEHGYRLPPEHDIRMAALLGDPVAPQPVTLYLTTLDGLTLQGLTTGTVTLPRRAVHLGVWLRLLRTLLDEVSAAPSRVKAGSRGVLEHIWHFTGRPLRAGLHTWRPYERLKPDQQEAMLEAAAVAVHLAEVGEITACGTLGPLLTREPHQHVHEGDRSVPSKWQEVIATLREVITLARSDRAAARQLLAVLTICCRTRALFEQQRDLLREFGVPAELIPTADEMGRDELG